MLCLSQVRRLLLFSENGAARLIIRRSQANNLASRFFTRFFSNIPPFSCLRSIRAARRHTLYARIWLARNDWHPPTSAWYEFPRMGLVFETLDDIGLPAREMLLAAMLPAVLDGRFVTFQVVGQPGLIRSRQKTQYTISGTLLRRFRLR